MLILVTFGLAVALIVGGTIAIIRTVKSNTEFSLLGVKLSTGVGVALLGIGLLLAYVTIVVGVLKQPVTPTHNFGDFTSRQEICCEFTIGIRALHRHNLPTL